MYLLLDMNHRMMMKRWVKKMYDRGVLIRTMYLIDHYPLYWKTDVDAYLETLRLPTDPLYQWRLAQRKYSIQSHDIDIGDWITVAEFSLIMPRERSGSDYGMTRSKTSLVGLHSRYVDLGGKTANLLFWKEDVVAKSKIIVSKSGRQPRTPEEVDAMRIHKFYHGPKRPEYRITKEALYDTA